MNSFAVSINDPEVFDTIEQLGKSFGFTWIADKKDINRNHKYIGFKIDNGTLRIDTSNVCSITRLKTLYDYNKVYSICNLDLIIAAIKVLKSNIKNEWKIDGGKIDFDRGKIHFNNELDGYGNLQVWIEDFHINIIKTIMNAKISCYPVTFDGTTLNIGCFRIPKEVVEEILGKYNEHRV